MHRYRITKFIVAFLAVGSVWGSAHAAYTGLTVERFATVAFNSTQRNVWRVYANFNNPNDQLTFVYGSPTLGTMTIESRNADDTGPGANFYNSAGGTNRAPTAEAIGFNPNNEWDSYFTIGISIADQAPAGDQMIFVPESPGLQGNILVTNDWGWYCLPDPSNLQSFAGFSGDDDDQSRVLIMQLTLQVGNNVRGTLGLHTWESSENVDPPGHFYTGQTFNSYVNELPGPGALGLLALGLLSVGFRYRKR